MGSVTSVPSQPQHEVELVRHDQFMSTLALRSWWESLGNCHVVDSPVAAHHIAERSQRGEPITVPAVGNALSRAA